MDPLRVASFASPLPSPTVWQGANYHPQPTTAPLYQSAHDLEPGRSPSTNYVDLALAIVGKDGARLKNEPSYTWPGRLLNWAFGWGEYNVKQLGVSVGGDKRTEHIRLVQEIYNNASIEVARKKKLEKTSQSTNQVYLQSSTAHQQRAEDPVYFVTHTYEDCAVADQTCKITLNSTLEEIGAGSNNIGQFSESYPNCLIQRVVGDYFNKVDLLPFSQSCLVKPGDPIYQEIDPAAFDVYPTGNTTYYIFDQDNISFSAKLVNDCYENNLIQESNDQTEPVVNYAEEEGLSCASGERTLLFPSFYCQLGKNNETWALTLSLFGNTPIGFPYQANFFDQYCGCSVESVNLYFQWIEGNATVCSFLDAKNTTLSYPIGNEGMFSIEAPAGLIAGQAEVSFPLDGIQQCFNKAYGEYSKKSKATDWTIGIIVGVSLGGTAAAMAFCTYKTKWLQKCYVRCLSKPHQPTIQNYEEIKSGDSLV